MVKDSPLKLPAHSSLLIAQRSFGQAMLGGVLLWAALPPLNLTPLAWIAPVFWILLIRGEVADIGDRRSVAFRSAKGRIFRGAKDDHSCRRCAAFRRRDVRHGVVP